MESLRVTRDYEPVQISLARLDERLQALVRDLERSERDRDRAIRLASDELARRLDDLNHAHQHATEVQSTYVPRETLNGFVKEATGRLNQLEGDAREQRGKLWLPMLAAAGIAAALAAAAVSLMFRVH